MAIKKIQMIPEGSNNYGDVLHPETSASQVVEETNKKFMTDAERSKLNGVASGANNYSHPSTHPYSMLTGVPFIPTHTSHLTNNSGFVTSAPTIVTGSYVGNGDYTNTRFISLGFTPKLVIVTSTIKTAISVNQYWGGIGFSGNYIKLPYDNDISGGNIVKIVTNGLNVRDMNANNKAFNASGVTYYYTAIY